jgi:glycosyltransferase involved in cell wall biosynthesis
LVRIYNPLDETSPALQPAAAAPPLGNPGILSIGRMDESKGFDRILAAFPACLKRYPGATLTLLGDGPHREALERQAAALGIAERVSMPGFDQDVSRQLRACNLFVLASRYEGLPNVLLEAVGAECPVVVVEHPGGTREIMELLGQAERMTTDLSEWRPAWFERPAADVRQAALEHFGLSSIVQQYAALVRETVDSQRIAA